MESKTAVKKQVTLNNTDASALSSEDRSLLWRSIRIGIYFLIIAAVFAYIYFSTKDLRERFVAAEQEYDENNQYTVTDLENGAMRVKGMVNGIEYEYVEDGKILPGVRVAGIELGGMDYAQAREALLADVERRIADINICANVENTTLLLTAADFNVSCDVNLLLHEAFNVGRSSEQTDFYSVYLERQRIAEEGVELGDYELTMDEESMRAIVDEIGAIVDKAPTEPYITLLNLVGGGKPGVGIGGRTDDLSSVKTVYAPDGTAMANIQFHNGQNGYVLDRDDMLKKICDAFYSENHNAELSLELKETEPDHSVEELAASYAELSRFSTRFSSSGDYRARNVQKAAGLLHCTVMLPEEEYGYNDLLGPRYEKDGWLPAPGISGGKEYIDSPGGGICQVSSTLYNSLLLLGEDAKIVRRYHHSIPGSYVDMGLDATVSYGGPDLVWKNMTDTSMLLFAYADMSNRTVYSIIYGVPREDGHTFAVWSELVEEVEPPEPLIIEEPMWPSGYTKMVITPRTGYNVDVFRQEYDADGNEVGEPVKLYQDKYAAVQGEQHVGTGSPSLPIPQG
ncbi:MAG: VanW family protein [Clostridia bacterium]|nr:VanW family protein [Clostridia bacterium]